MAEKKATPIRILYDYWDEDGNRLAAGSEIKVSVATAKAMIAAGKAERADPLPGA